MEFWVFIYFSFILSVFLLMQYWQPPVLEKNDEVKTVMVGQCASQNLQFLLPVAFY